ncbi:hypothetical protein [Polymorphospora sp. NPDC050346]|uniref:hypothetical protein n=1 Tax=Polymorphospora sp. NPDC050346 TaxID=3155780 RepID=UPI003405ECBD
MTSPPPDYAGRPPWTRPGFIAAAVLVAVVLVIGLVVALQPRDDPPPPTVTPPTAGPIDPGPAGTATAAPHAIPTTAPDGITWELVGQVAVPVHPTAGPRTRTGGTAAGYAHDPVGALVAAAQIAVRAGISAGRDSWEPTIERQFVPGPDRDRLLDSLLTAADAPSQPGELSQIAGYSYLSYTPDTAVIGLALRAPSAGSPRYHVLTLTLLWRDGDWRMQAPPGGAWTAVNRIASDLTGVVEWGPR